MFSSPFLTTLISKLLAHRTLGQLFTRHELAAEQQTYTNIKQQLHVAIIGVAGDRTGKEVWGQ